MLLTFLSSHIAHVFLTFRPIIVLPTCLAYLSVCLLALPALPALPAYQSYCVIMDWDDRAERAHDSLSDEWFNKYIMQKSRIADWVSSFRDGHPPSKIIGTCCGSFNWSCRLLFEDQVEWLLRFAVPGKVMDRDEKLCREVAVMVLVREKTKIPVPKVHAWGVSTENPLGLGPFIIMDYIPNGKSLGHLWRVSDKDKILRTNISQGDMRKVFHQIAKFYLELSELVFPNIGSLSIGDDQSIRSDLSPLTLKMQEIEAHGGVKTGGKLNLIYNNNNKSKFIREPLTDVFIYKRIF
jgi:hypothetical protein